MERAGFQLGEIREGLKAGGAVQSAFIVARLGADPERTSFVAYVRVSWRVGYHMLQAFRGRADRVYSNLGRLVYLLAVEFGTPPPIQVYTAGCDRLRRFKNLHPQDQGGAASAEAPPEEA